MVVRLCCCTTVDQVPSVDAVCLVFVGRHKQSGSASPDGERGGGDFLGVAESRMPAGGSRF